MSRIILVLICLAAALPAAEEITPAIEKSTARGIKWLVQAQNRDGSWGMDARTTPDVACTAIVGLALLAAGNTERDGPDPASVAATKKAVDYLLLRTRKMAPRGDIAQGEHTQIHNYIGQNTHTFLAALFLSQVYGMRSPDFSAETYLEMRHAIEKLTDAISFTQERDGSWHKDTYSSLQATAMAWMALRSSASSGAVIKAATVDKTLAFIRKQYNAGSRSYDLHCRNNQIYASASALRILYGSGLREQPQTNAAMDNLLQSLVKGGWGQHFLLNTGEDYPAAVMITHALVQEGGDRWQLWYDFVAKKLQKLQNADGSWTTSSCLVGRTFATACSVLCLQTPARLLPIQEL